MSWIVLDFFFKIEIVYFVIFSKKIFVIELLADKFLIVVCKTLVESDYFLNFYKKNLTLNDFIINKKLALSLHKGPIFYYHPWLKFFLKNFNLWNQYFYFNDLDFQDFVSRRVSGSKFKNLRWHKWNYYQYKLNSNFSNEKYFLLKILFLSDNLNQSLPIKNTFYTDDLIFSFTRKITKMNLANYILKNYNFFSYFYFPVGHGKLSTSNHYNYFQYYNSNRLLLVNSLNDFFLNNNFKEKRTSSDFIKLCHFFNQLNEIITSSLQKKYKTKFLHYEITSLQIKHLMSLNYEQIQQILWLMRYDRRFVEWSFLDVHWELYNDSNNTFNNVDFLKRTIYPFSSETKVFNIFYLLKNIFFELSPTPTINKNPFNLYYSNFTSNKLQQKIFFNEYELFNLPIHILLSSVQGVEIYPRNFLTYNIFVNSRLNTLHEVMTVDFLYQQKLLRFFRNYGKFNESTFDALYHFGRRKLSYQKNYFILINPWWESLTPEFQEKLISLFEKEGNNIENFFLKNIESCYKNGLNCGMVFSEEGG